MFAEILREIKNESNLILKILATLNSVPKPISPQKDNFSKLLAFGQIMPNTTPLDPKANGRKLVFNLY